MVKKKIILYILVSADLNFGKYESAESTPEQVTQAHTMIESHRLVQ